MLTLARIFIKHNVRPPVANPTSSSGHHPDLLSELFGIMMKYFSLQLSLLETQQQEGQSGKIAKIKAVIEVARIVQTMEKRDDWADYVRLKKDLRRAMQRTLEGVESTEDDTDLQVLVDTLELLQHEMFTAVALAKTVNRDLEVLYERRQ